MNKLKFMKTQIDFALYNAASDKSTDNAYIKCLNSSFRDENLNVN